MAQQVERSEQLYLDGVWESSGKLCPLGSAFREWGRAMLLEIAGAGDAR